MSAEDRDDRWAVTPRTEADGDEETGGRRKYWLIALAVLAIGIAAAAALWLFRPQPEGEEPPERPPFVAVEPVVPREGPIDVTGNGTVRPRAEIGLSPEVGGRVVFVSPRLVSGGRVARGETLIRIEASDYRSQVEQARAEVAQAQLELDRAVQQRVTAREELARLRDLLGPDGAGGGGAAGFEGDFRSPGEPAAPGARARRAGALLSTPTPLARGEPQVAAARAALDGARARLDTARRALGRTRITAPFAGVVRSEQVDIGEYVTPGRELARLYAADAVEVVVPLTQAKAALVPNLFARGGARVPATVTTDYGGRRYAWSGYVDRALGDVDEATRTIDVVVRVPRPFTGGRPAGGGATAGDAPPLLVGFFTTVTIEGTAPGRYFEVPRDALRDGDRLWLVRDGRLRFVPVAVITASDERLFVRAAGLAPGDRVAVGALETATDGMPVRTRTEGPRPGVAAARSGGAGTRYDGPAR